MRLPLMFIVTCLIAFSSYASVNTFEMHKHTALRDTTPPKVFMFGEYDKGLDALSIEYQDLLLSVCNNDVQVAFDMWMSMLRDMEAYAQSIDFNLKGIKVWLHVFWEKDGSIKHIVYHLKPQSKYVDSEELKAFYVSFMNNYTLPIKHTGKFSNYSSAAFPLFPKRLNEGSSSGDPIAKDKNHY